jgi:hypothetical protein
MLRSLLIIALLTVSGAAAAETATQVKLAAFMASIDDSEVRPLDRRNAVCLTEHATRNQVRRLVKKADADDKDGFVALMTKFTKRRAKLQDCVERAVLRAMFGG